MEPTKGKRKRKSENLTSKPNKIDWRQPRKLQAILTRLSLTSWEECFQGEAYQRKEKSDEQNNPIIFFCFISPQKARPWLTLHTHLELVSA